jgi:hypothetical protein
MISARFKRKADRVLGFSSGVPCDGNEQNKRCGHVTCGECLASSIVSQHNSSLGVFPPFLQPVGARITNGM